MTAVKLWPNDGDFYCCTGWIGASPLPHSTPTASQTEGEETPVRCFMNEAPVFCSAGPLVFGLHRLPIRDPPSPATHSAVDLEFGCRRQGRPLTQTPPEHFAYQATQISAVAPSVLGTTIGLGFPRKNCSEPPRRRLLELRNKEHPRQTRLACGTLLLAHA